MSLAQELWETNADLAEAALKHPFVQGLAQGTLPRQSFQRYIAQDAYFLDAFVRAYALTLAHVPDRRDMYVFFDLLAGVQEELRLHQTYAARWDMSLEEVVPQQATLAYTEFLLARAALGRIGETCAAMVPCVRLYAFLGQALARQGGGREDNPYGEWVRTYASADSADLAARLEIVLDRYARDTPAVRDVYRRAMTLEVAFFEANR